MADHMGGISTGQDFSKAIDDVIGAFEENVTIKKYSSRATDLPAEGTTPAIVYKLIQTTAVIDDIGLEKLTGRDGVFAAGDLQFQTRIPLAAPDDAAGTPGDRIIYDSVEYRLVQKSMPEYIGGVVYYTCIARRITA